MKTIVVKPLLSKNRVRRIKAQGYFNYTDSEITELAFGNRFAYILCTMLMTAGVITANVTLLTLVAIIAFLSILLPYHPFDYIYNHIIRKAIYKPQLPRRSAQLKFACTMASAWMALTIIMFSLGYMIVGYVLGGMLIGVASLVSTTDYCIPSELYNAVRGIRVD